jgi:Lrp/AsnC family transcriptional regulator, leucine-responsive regulatory protein
MRLDNVDKKILRVVQRNCLIAADELAEQAHTSASTALRRLKRLRDNGVITKESAHVDAAKIGRPLLLIVGVRLERDDSKIVSAFVNELRANEAVMQCFFVTGTADYVIHFSARDMAEYDAFVQSTLVANPHVVVTETNVVINALKLDVAVPID